jgi:wobble nucleotide-excising tRNase
LDNKNCGIIFDDPVTSLDHERKDKIAERLTKEANQRQVLILTHDMVFMSQLVKYAINLIFLL